MIDEVLLAKLIDEHIASKGCSLFGRAWDVGTDEARSSVAKRLAADFLAPVLAQYLAHQLHPSGALTRGNGSAASVTPLQAKSAAGTQGPSKTNGDVVTPFTPGTRADQGEPHNRSRCPTCSGP